MLVALFFPFPLATISLFLLFFHLHPSRARHLPQLPVPPALVERQVKRYPKFLTFFVLSHHRFFFKEGTFTYVQNTNNLRTVMATYYDFFSSNTVRNEPIISIPYIDAFGLGKNCIIKSIEFMFQATNMFWAWRTLILARAARQELKWALKRAQSTYFSWST